MGTTAHLSPLVQKTKRLGVRTPEDLQHIALARGLRYFGQINLASDGLRPESPMPALDREHFSNEELAIALMSPSLPYSLTRLRMAAAMLGANGNSAEKILRLARMERCEPIVRHIAECAPKSSRSTHSGKPCSRTFPPSLPFVLTHFPTRHVLSPCPDSIVRAETCARNGFALPHDTQQFRRDSPLT
jgi:hypothetical protein